MFAPAAAGAAVSAHRGLRRRKAALGANRAAEDALIADLFERTPVVVMKVAVVSATLQESLRGKGLRIRVKIDDKELFTSDTAKAVASETQCAQFDFNVVSSFMLEGDSVLSFELLQPHPILPSKTLGTCMLPLSEVRDALGGGPLTNAVGRPLTQELVLSAPKKAPEEVLGGLQVMLELERSTLAAASAGLAAEPRPGSPATNPAVRGAAVPEQQVLLTADGGRMVVRSFLCPTAGRLKTEALRLDAAGREVERVEWDDDA